MADEIIYRNRIITNEWHLAPVSVKRIASSFLSLTSKENESKDLNVSIVNSNIQKFSLELSQYELFISKTKSIHARCLIENKDYEQVIEDIENQIKSTLIEIESLKNELAKEKVVRERRVEYEEISKNIIKHKSKEALSGNISSIDADIANAQKESATLISLVSSRKNAVSKLLESIVELQLSFRDNIAGIFSSELEMDVNNREEIAGYIRESSLVETTEEASQESVSEESQTLQSPSSNEHINSHNFSNDIEMTKPSSSPSMMMDDDEEEGQVSY
jgi:Tho complex subunit 7